MLRSLACGACAALLFLAHAGCTFAPPTGTVSGQVRCKNKPVTEGEIHFYMKEKGIAASARLSGTGQFAMAQPLPVGTYRVFVTPPTPEPAPPGQSPPSKVYPNIPLKSRDMQTSGLTATVEAKENALELVLSE